MGIRLKLLLAFVICFGMMAGISLPVLEHSMNASYEAIEQRDLTANMGRVVQGMEANLEHLNSQTRDWATWTEMYNFAHKPNMAWAQENIGKGAMGTADMSLVMIYDAHGKLLLMTTRNRQGGELALRALPDSPYAALFRAPLPEPRCGLMKTDAGLMLTCWAGITRSDFSGEYSGVLVMGRLMDETFQSRLRAQTKLPFEFRELRELPQGLTQWPNRLSAGMLQVRDFASTSEPMVYHLFSRVRDLLQQEVAVIALDVSRDVREQGQLLYRQARQQLVLTAVAVAVLLGLVVHFLLIRRLRKFSAQLVTLAEGSNWQSRIDITGRDELGLVARNVNKLLALIASQVESLQSLTLTDQLTGLPNRRAFDARLALEYSREKRNERPLALLVLDVDHFKRFNDRYGHPAGDGALREVAQVLRVSVSRVSDLAARIGGEEFAIVLPETDAAGAKALAERIHANLQQRRVPHVESSVAPHLTVSIGIAMAGDDSMEQFVSRADQALYQAKAQGRNRACMDALDETVHAA